MKTGRPLFLSRDIFCRISHQQVTLSQDGQLVQQISCRLLVGFRHGWHCCVHIVLPHRLTGLDFVVRSTTSSLDRKIRIQPEKSSFPAYFHKNEGNQSLQIKTHPVSRSFSIEWTCLSNFIIQFVSRVEKSGVRCYTCMYSKTK